MTSYLQGKNGTELEMTIIEGQTLTFLALGLQEKIGIYGPLPEEDCKIIARILRNKANWLKIVSGDATHGLQEFYNICLRNPGGILSDKIDYFDDPYTHEWLLRVADWFDNCGGLVEDE